MSYLEKQFSLSGKTALITGGGGTLCGEIAAGMLQAGAKVILWGRHLTTLQTKVTELKQKYNIDADNINLMEVDLTVEAQVAQALEQSVKQAGDFHILVNGVGGSSIRCGLSDLDIEEFDQVMRLNLIAGCVLPVKHVAKYWKQKKIAGAVVNIASMGSFNPLSGAWAYSAAKAAVVNQTMAQARELAQHNIRVNAIAPGFFIGKQNRKLLLNDDGSPTARGQRVLDHTPMGRFGQATELSGAVIFLSSDAGSFISGATLPIDGAYLCDNI